jgi:hypothetical protein
MPDLPEDEDKLVRPMDFIAETPFTPVAPLPEGKVPHLALAPSEPTPPADPEHFVCLRGPCRHYTEIVSLSDAESKIPGFVTTQINRYCGVVRGVIIDLTEDNVFSCSRWDPEEADGGISQRRASYFKEHPGVEEADATRLSRKAEILRALAVDADAREAKDAADKEKALVAEWARAIEEAKARAAERACPQCGKVLATFQEDAGGSYDPLLVVAHVIKPGERCPGSCLPGVAPAPAEPKETP